MEFRPIRIEDRETIEHYARRFAAANCDRAFANIYCWEFLYRSAWCVVEDFLIIRFQIDGGPKIGYMEPLGAGDFATILPLLRADAAAHGQRLRLMGLTAEGCERLRRTGGSFAFDSRRAQEDYLYRRSDLAELPGRKYQPKRNHIRRFESHYPDYRYEPLTRTHFTECLRLEAAWRKTRPGHTGDLSAELRAMQRAFDHWEKLGLRGGCLHVGDRLVAFTYGSPINETCFCIHAEKADTTFDGAFAMINRLFASQLPENFTLINREEDLGIEGLRRAKLSYQPTCLERKFVGMELHPDEQQCKALWQKCFNDEEEFIDSFLIRHYRRSRMLYRTAERQIVAMLHLIPFESELGHTTYIYGVATDPAQRGRGLATELLHEAMQTIRERGDDAAILIPGSEELKGFYSAHGFRDCALPVRFPMGDDFDFGTGNPAADRAMVWLRDPARPLPETILCL